MKEPQKGLIVRSTSGRDIGRYYVITEVEATGFVWLVDGKLHPIDRPKKKNPKHLAFTARVVAVDQTTTDRQFRRLLAPYQGAETDDPNSTKQTERSGGC